MPDIDLSSLTPRARDPSDRVVVMKEGSPDEMGLVPIEHFAPSAATYADAALGADVALVANNTWYDGPAVTLAAGTWLINITGHYRRNTTGAANVAVRAFGGAAIHAHGETYHASVNGAQVQVSSHGIAVLTGSTTITLQMLTSTGSVAALMKADTQNNPQGNMATRITAIKLA